MSENEKGAYGQVLKYTGIFGGVQGLNVIVSLVRNKLAAILLGPAGMGLVSLFNVTVAFISQATSLLYQGGTCLVAAGSLVRCAGVCSHRTFPQ